MEQLAVARIVEEIFEKKFEDYASRYLSGHRWEHDFLGSTERLIRLEEELKAQRELMEARFEAMDKRFEDLIQHMDKRFEAVDKRFEDLIQHMDKRFEAVDKRFEAVDKRFEDMNRRFTMLTWFISSLFGALAVLMTVYKFVGATPSP